jgi:hypothetical protein
LFVYGEQGADGKFDDKLVAPELLLGLLAADESGHERTDVARHLFNL